MGRFEDLIEQAKEGDIEALNALESEFSGSTLRQQAEEAAALKTKLEQSMPLLRKARLDDLVARLDEDMRAVGLGVEDFGDFDPDDLTLEKVQDAAKQKVESTQAAKQSAAQAAGFESVEEYEQALSTVKQQQEQRRSNMEIVASGVASSGGEAPGTGQGQTLHEIGQEAFKTAKDEGRADDWAMANSVQAILDAQSPPEE